MNKPRLIDANEPIKIIGNMIKPLITPDGATLYDPDIQAYDEGLVAALETIDECPTAYDVDKVVEQLEALQDFEERTGKGYCPDRDTECRYMYSDLGCGHCAFEKAIEIVKGGAE